MLQGGKRSLEASAVKFPTQARISRYTPPTMRASLLWKRQRLLVGLPSVFSQCPTTSTCYLHTLKTGILRNEEDLVYATRLRYVGPAGPGEGCAHTTVCGRLRVAQTRQS